MFTWFKRKSKLEKLRERYTALMRKSYEVALRDPQKSEIVHTQADRIYKEIQFLTFQHQRES